MLMLWFVNENKAIQEGGSLLYPVPFIFFALMYCTLFGTERAPTFNRKKHISDIASLNTIGCGRL